VRWWNVKHPSAYAGRLADRAPHPPPARESSTPEQRHDEEVLLRVRLRDGLPVDVLDRTAARRRRRPRR
jgi:coproporphyrinogen III oxidase-like Fe-S oxidoreductase